MITRILFVAAIVLALSTAAVAQTYTLTVTVGGRTVHTSSGYSSLDQCLSAGRRIALPYLKRGQAVEHDCRLTRH